MITDANVINFLRLAQGVNINISVQSVVSKLALQSSARGNIIPVSVGNRITFRGIPAVDRKVTVVSLGSTLLLSSTLRKGPANQVAFNNLNLYHRIVNTGFYGVKSTLTLAQNVNVIRTVASIEHLHLAQAISLVANHVANVNSFLPLASKQAHFKPSPNYIINVDALLHSKFPYFQYGNMKVIIRPPEFGNTEKIQQNRIMRRSRAGDLIIFRDNQWPAMETLHMDIKFLKQETASELVDFMRQTMGLQVTFFDSEERTWTGFIMTPAAQIAEQLKNSFSITIEFQGIQN